MILPQFILAVVIMLTGYIMFKFPPKTINPIYGYRTRASMRNADTWNFAQRVASRKFILVGLLLLLIAMLEWLIDVGAPWHSIIMAASLILSFIYVFSNVEKQLAKRFPQDK